LCACGFAAEKAPDDLAGAPCTVVPHAGCPPGDKCVYFGGGTRCTPDGTVPPAGRCTTSRDDDTCMGAATCDFVGDGGFGVCAPYCVTDGNCTPYSLSPANPSRCRFPAGEPPRCTIPCDPLRSPLGCPTSEFGCYLVSTAGGSSPAVSECIPAGLMTPIGGNCDHTYDCVAGAMCLFSVSGTCRQLCATDAQCSGTDTCVRTGSLNDTYGVCCPPGC
jgi:hypothetical protein